MLIIHGRATSSNVQPVMWLTAELGLEVDRRDVGGAFGGTDTPEYRAMNPNGLVPVMQDGALTMFESPAILRYLAASRGAEHLWPSDPVTRAPVDLWMEWAKTSFATMGVTQIFWATIRTRPADRDPGALAAAEARMKAWVRIAEDRLAAAPFIAGDAFSLADITFATHLYRYYAMDFDRLDAPNLRAYYDRMAENPRYAEHAMVDFESLRVR